MSAPAPGMVVDRAMTTAAPETAQPSSANTEKPAQVSIADKWSDDYIAEHGYLVERGVRPLAIVGHIRCDGVELLRVASRLEIISTNMTVIPFVIMRHDGIADCGFAAMEWVVDLYQWITTSDIVPKEHAHRIRGLLLGYSADAIRAHEARTSGRRFTW